MSSQEEIETATGMEAWRYVWRNGFAPLLSTESLIVLRDLLIRDDPRLLQGSTCTPPPLMAVMSWPVEAACPIGCCGWLGDGLETVEEVESFFARMCFMVDQNINEPAGCRHLLNWIDETPRSEMISQLLPEVDRVLDERANAVAISLS